MDGAEKINITVEELAQNPFTRVIPFKVRVFVNTDEELKIVITPNVLASMGEFTPSSIQFYSTGGGEYEKVFNLKPLQSGTILYSFSVKAISSRTNYANSYRGEVVLNPGGVRVPPKPGYYVYVIGGILFLVIGGVVALVGLKKLLIWLRDVWFPRVMSEQQARGV